MDCQRRAASWQQVLPAVKGQSLHAARIQRGGLSFRAQHGQEPLSLQR